MGKKLIGILVWTLIIVSCERNRDIKIVYPETPASDGFDVYFGDTIADPYQWMEAIHSDSTSAWIETQNKVTFDYLSQIPFREKIRQDLIKIQQYPYYQRIGKHGNKYYLNEFKRDSNTFNLYVTDHLNTQPQLILNYNSLSGLDSLPNLRFGRISPDNHYYAYLYTLPEDSGKCKIRISDLEKKRDLPEMLEGIPSSCQWLDWHEGKLYYMKPGGIYCHQPDTWQESDSLYLHHYCTQARFSEDSRFLFIIDGSNNLCIKQIDKRNTNVIIIDKYKYKNRKIYDFGNIQNIDDTIYVWTNRDAPNGKYMKLNISSGKPQWETLIPESKDILDRVCIAGGKIVAAYLHNAYSQLFVYDMDGSNKTELPLPGIGSVEMNTGDPNDVEMFFSFSSFAVPATFYYIKDIRNPQVQMYKTNTPDIDTDSYLTKQLWCTSKDGTRIPLFITCKKGLEPDGKNPLLLSGYGGFGKIQSPYFFNPHLLFMKKGGIYVEACLRGGGEFGEEWHEGGMKLNKQNTFDDFIAVAEYLIDNKYTSPEKLAINGGSNGGLLVSACMVQRPDLYRVVIDHRGVMDMLFLRWTNEYGTLENEDEYRYFLGYSPLHQIKQGVNYPATWISTGMNDVVVPPWQSFKFAAAMQLAQGSSQPVLLRTDSIAGHNSISIEEDTDWLSFLFWNLDMNY